MNPELPKSPLPRDPEYWSRLAAEIRADAAGPLAGYAAAGEAWYGVLARRAPWLAAAAATIILVLWVALPPDTEARSVDPLQRAVAPEDAAGSLVAGPGPPPVELLMVQFAPPIGEVEE